MNPRPTRHLLALLMAFCLAAISARAADPFTNSATLAVSFDGTNVLLRAEFAGTNGAFTLVQGARPDALTLPACSCQISNQIFDIGWVPAARQVQWTLTNWPASSARFFRLQLEPFLTRGRALVFKDGPLDFDAMRRTYGDITNNYQNTSIANPTNTTPMIFKQPVEVWIDNLGEYDTNGLLVASNEGKLSGRYAKTELYTVDEYVPGFAGLGTLPNIAEIHSATNDFRINFQGDQMVTPRQAALWHSEAQFYHDVNDYRVRFLNDAFITELGLPPELERNVRTLQYRPDLQFTAFPGVIPTRQKAILEVLESFRVLGIQIFPIPNALSVPCRSRAPYQAFESSPPLSLIYDSSFTAGEYAGLVAFWITGTNVDGFTTESGFGLSWQSNILPVISDGINAWVAYRYSGTPEIASYLNYAFRIANGRPCGGTNVPCDKGYSMRNVMMFDEGNTSGDGVFPFSRIGNPSYDGPSGSDLAAQYTAAIFYDIANEAGLGIHRADLLIWKSISLTTGPPLSMRTYGSKIQEAARLLWPDPRAGREGKSLYEEDINDVLTSRGIPLNGVADFRTNLPPAIGSYPETLERNIATRFGSLHPEVQPGGGSPGNYNTSQQGYTDPDTNAAYVAFQFYKHSKYGPCDKLAMTDGTFTVNTVAPFDWHYNNDGTYYLELTDRELGNLVLFAPNRTIRWLRSRQHCPNEATGFYAEDMRPFGFRVIQATPNGFSFTATALSETATNKTYQLTIVDPSLTSVGPADYQWSFTNYLGETVIASGTSAQYTALKDQPFTIHIARTRNGETNTLTLRERGNDLDRSGGRAFVRNLVP